MSQSSPGTNVAPAEPLLSLGEAARRAGCSKRELRERIERGEIAVRLVVKGKRTRLRVTPSALREAGYASASLLVPADHDVPAPAWLAVIQEQAARLAAVEDQRAQLAGQLGVALERLRVLEARLDELAVKGPRALPEGRPVRVRAMVKVGTGAATLGVLSALGVATVRRATRAWHR